jgi:hypothetical protein
MTDIQNFVAAADLQGLVAYLGVMGTFLTAVAWATYCDFRKESWKKSAWAVKTKVVVLPSKSQRTNR